MVREIPKTISPSSSKRMDDQSVPDYGASPDRITEAAKTGILGNVPIRVTQEVKYDDYENDKRMTEDFDQKNADDAGSSPLDGTTVIAPQGEPASSFVVTEFSEK